MTANNLLFRRMGEGEISVVAALEEQHFSTPWSESELQKTLQDETTVFWIAFIGDQPVGYISRTHSFETMDILTVCVAQESRRQGIARALLAFLEAEARDKSVDKIFLEVRESNAAARALYERCGYCEISRRKRYYKDPVEDALILQKEIKL